MYQTVFAIIIAVALYYYCYTTINNRMDKNTDKTVYGTTASLTDAVRGFVPADIQNKLDNAQVEAKEWIVYYNMADLKKAVLDWANDHDHKFPYCIDNNMNPYLLKTMNRIEMLPTEYISGKGIFNPFTKNFEWPTPGNITDVMTTRKSNPPSIPPGQIQYTQINNGEHYAILGGAANGLALPELYLKPQGCKTTVESDVFTLK